MAILDQRIIFSDNGTLIDYSHELNNYNSRTATLPFVAAEDALYIGSDLPWNHLYFLMDTVNTAAAELSVELWKSKQDGWVSAVDILDDTASSGVPLSKSGHSSWVLDKDEGWSRADTDDMDSSGLETLKIYDLFWAKITWSADLDAGTAIRYIGQKFSEDEDLGVLYPDLNTSRSKTAFATGKTSWEEQHIVAAQIIFRELSRTREDVISKNQIIRWDWYQLPAVFKTAEIIFNAFGKDYEDLRNEALRNYEQQMDLRLTMLDYNENTRLDGQERAETGGLVRR